MVNVVKYILLGTYILFILGDIALNLIISWNYTTSTTSFATECPLLCMYSVPSAVDCSDPGTPLRTALEQLHVTACTHVLTLIVIW